MRNTYMDRAQVREMFGIDNITNGLITAISGALTNAYHDGYNDGTAEAIQPTDLHSEQVLANLYDKAYAAGREDMRQDVLAHLGVE